MHLGNLVSYIDYLLLLPGEHLTNHGEMKNQGCGCPVILRPSSPSRKGCRLTDLKRLLAALHLCFPSLRLQQFNLFISRWTTFSEARDHSSFPTEVIPPHTHTHTHREGKHEKQTQSLGLNFGTKRHKCHRKSNKAVRMMSAHAHTTSVSQSSTYATDTNTHITHARRKATSLNLPSGGSFGGLSV